MYWNNNYYPECSLNIHGMDKDIKPPAGYLHYSNPDCQGSLMCATVKWTNKPKNGYKMDSAYVDRMWSWDEAKWKKACAVFPKTNLNDAIRSSSEQTLIKFAKIYFDKDIIAVRWVYYYNQATGYDCQRIDYIYKV